MWDLWKEEASWALLLLRGKVSTILLYTFCHFRTIEAFKKIPKQMYQSALWKNCIFVNLLPMSREVEFNNFTMTLEHTE